MKIIPISKIKRIYNSLSLFINIPAGLGGALMMGTIVWFINADHGFWPAMVAALKQAGYTFLVAGLFIRFLEYQVTRIDHKYLAIFVSVVVTSLMTIGLVYIVHSIKGTPKPFYSTLATILLAPFGYLGLAIRTRKIVDKKKDDIPDEKRT